MHIEVHAKYFIFYIILYYIIVLCKESKFGIAFMKQFYLFNKCKRLLKKSRNHVKTIEHKVELCGFSFFTGIERYPIGF